MYCKIGDRIIFLLFYGFFSRKSCFSNNKMIYLQSQFEFKTLAKGPES